MSALYARVQVSFIFFFFFYFTSDLLYASPSTFMSSLLRPYKTLTSYCHLFFFYESQRWRSCVKSFSCSLQPAWPSRAGHREWATAGQGIDMKKKGDGYSIVVRREGCETIIINPPWSRKSIVCLLAPHTLHSSFSHFLLLQPLWSCARRQSLQSFITLEAFIVRGHKKMLRNGFPTPFTRRSVLACV